MDFYEICIGITYGNSKFIAVGAKEAIYTSSDGISWTSRNSVTNRDLNAIIYANNIFMTVGGRTFTSSDGVTWTQKSSFSEEEKSYSKKGKAKAKESLRNM